MQRQNMQNADYKHETNTIYGKLDDLKSQQYYAVFLRGENCLYVF